MALVILLTQGQRTFVDDEFADLAQYNWSASFKPNYGRGGAFIATRNMPIGNGKYKTLPMHREIMGRMLGRELKRDELVDHVDVNPLNNLISNLRLADASQSSRNRPLQKNNASGYKGVSFRRDRGKWAAQIGHLRGLRQLGLFDTPEEAHEAYCKAADDLHQEFKNYG